MKLLGLSSGRKMGSCEIMLKEALMGAEENGATVEFVRLYDLDIKSCRFCKNCLRIERGPEACVVKDDIPFMWEKFMDCDGMIIAAPVYILALPGYLKLLADRMIQDLSGIMMTKNLGNISPMTGNKVFIDERAFKKRVSAFISVGGAVTPHWVSLGLPMMHCITFPKQFDLVDQIQVLSVSTVLGAVVLNEKTINRARLLGHNVATEMNKLVGKQWRGDELGSFTKQSADKPDWYGDEPGTCPVCHSNLLIVGKENPVVCPICGSKGTINVIGTKITVTFTQEEQAISRLTLEGKRIHQDEIRECTNSLLPKVNDIEKKFAKYNGYLTPQIPFKAKK
jgi:multimeric flavodoxin WrbA